MKNNPRLSQNLLVLNKKSVARRSLSQRENNQQVNNLS